MKINLGGLCGKSTWREELISKVGRKDIEFVNPMVSNWVWNSNTKQEKQARIKSCDYLVYFIAPTMQGYSSIASAVDYSNKYPNKLLYCQVDTYQGEHFTKHQLESLKAVKDIILDNGGKVFDNLTQLIDYIKNL